MTTLRKTLLSLLIQAILGLFAISAFARSTKCDESWLTRTDQTFDVGEATRVCLHQDMLLSENVLVCTAQKAEYKKAFDLVCSLVKNGEFAQVKPADLRKTLRALHGRGRAIA